jgi:hypothetical protein
MFKVMITTDDTMTVFLALEDVHSIFAFIGNLVANKRSTDIPARKRPDKMLPDWPTNTWVLKNIMSKLS